jgi:hypothetical protein
MVPYGPLADVLRRRGFETGTLMGGYRHVAGNMRKYFPKARIIALKGPVYVPPTRHPEGAPIAVVWNPRTEGWALPERAKLELEKIGIRAFAEPETVQIPWKHVWKPDGYRHSEWRYLVIRRSFPQAGTAKRQSPKK